MTKDELIRSLTTARAEGRVPRAPYGADLGGADLRGADLGGADLRGAIHPHIMPINAGRSGDGALWPTHEGWRISIGCWRGKTLQEFDQLLADEVPWPEASGDERERRRPLLQAVRALCDAFVASLPDDLIDQHKAEYEQWQAEQAKKEGAKP